MFRRRPLRLSADEFGFSLPISLAEHVLLNLSRSRARQRVDELDAARALEVSKVLAAEVDQLLLGG